MTDIGTLPWPNRGWWKGTRLAVLTMPCLLGSVAAGCGQTTTQPPLAIYQLAAQSAFGLSTSTQTVRVSWTSVSGEVASAWAPLRSFRSDLGPGSYFVAEARGTFKCGPRATHQECRGIVMFLRRPTSSPPLLAGSRAVSHFWALPNAAPVQVGSVDLGSSYGPQVVPSVVGLSSSQAFSELHAMGLSMRAVGERDVQAIFGSALSQSPVPGKPLPRDRTVVVKFAIA